jgi:hypothetical protein
VNAEALLLYKKKPGVLRENAGLEIFAQQVERSA